MGREREAEKREREREGRIDSFSSWSEEEEDDWYCIGFFCVVFYVNSALVPYGFWIVS